MLEAFVETTLQAIAEGAAPPPAALLVLLRVYAATAREDVCSALGTSLASAAAASPNEAASALRPDWLRLYAEACRLSDDARLRDAASATAAQLIDGLPLEATCARRADALHALLSAAPILDACRIVPPAVDQLEQLVAADYVPGGGLRGRSVDEVIAVALALVAAFDVTGRLAYPMLAEELIRSVRHLVETTAVPVRCGAARVLGRLARLHDDPGYRATAVVAPEADYDADCRALLATVGARCRTPDERVAYALALTECGERS